MLATSRPFIDGTIPKTDMPDEVIAVATATQPPSLCSDDEDSGADRLPRFNGSSEMRGE